MEDPISKHLQALRESRYSSSSLRERERVLRSISGDILALDRHRTQDWWATRQTMGDGRPRSASSLSQESSHLRRFCRWAMQQGLVERNAADWLPDVRQQKPAAQPVPEGTYTNSWTTRPKTSAA